MQSHSDFRVGSCHENKPARTGCAVAVGRYGCRIVKAARAGGMAGTARAYPGLMSKLPLEFKAMSMNVHHEMDEIADAAENGRPTAKLLKMTSNAMEKCVACHAVWQLKANK